MINQEVLDLIIAAIILSAIWAQLGTFMSHKVRIVTIQSLLLSIYIIVLGIWNSDIELITLGILIIILRAFLTSRLLNSKLSPDQFVSRRDSGTHLFSALSVFSF